MIFIIYNLFTYFLLFILFYFLFLFTYAISIKSVNDDIWQFKKYLYNIHWERKPR